MLHCRRNKTLMDIPVVIRFSVARECGPERERGMGGMGGGSDAPSGLGRRERWERRGRFGRGREPGEVWGAGEAWERGGIGLEEGGIGLGEAGACAAER
jgi:hypothetical protein